MTNNKDSCLTCKFEPDWDKHKIFKGYAGYCEYSITYIPPSWIVDAAPIGKDNPHTNCPCFEEKR